MNERPAEGEPDIVLVNVGGRVYRKPRVERPAQPASQAADVDEGVLEEPAGSSRTAVSHKVHRSDRFECDTRAYLLVQRRWKSLLCSTSSSLEKRELLRQTLKRRQVCLALGLHVRLMSSLQAHALPFLVQDHPATPSVHAEGYSLRCSVRLPILQLSQARMSLRLPRRQLGTPNVVPPAQVLAHILQNRTHYGSVSSDASFQYETVPFSEFHAHIFFSSLLSYPSCGEQPHSPLQARHSSV